MMKKKVNKKGIYPINEIAKWFLTKGSMNHRKLQKLCYYAEAWYIVFNNKKLYSDTNFEGWVHGPVSSKLFSEYKHYGYLDIPEYRGDVLIDKETAEHLEVICSTYLEYDGYQLSNFTHQEDPWIESRLGLGEFERGTKELELETIRDYYLKILEEVSV